jgi:hypothetical protein
MDDGMAAPARVIREIRTRAPAVPAARQGRPLVIVLGAEGSGVSLCSRVLSALDVEMTNNAARPQAGRPMRNGAAEAWERPEISGLHDRILALFGVDPGDDFELPVSWWADPRVAEIRREMATFVDERIGSGRFSFQDRRTMRLMPVWNQLAKELNLAPKIVHCLRNPAQVARVLHARDGIPLGLGEFRWFTDTVEFFRHVRHADLCTVEYDEWFVDRAANLRKLRRFLELPEALPESDTEEAIYAIIDNERLDGDQRPGEARQPLIRSAYRLARRADHDAAARDQLQHIAGQLLSFRQLHAAARGSTEGTASAAGGLPGKMRPRAGNNAPAPRYCVSPASFWQPEYVVPSAWHQHAPFAFWLTDALRPGIFVELGAHNGFSYLAFCQAVQRLGGMTKCYAVDTWMGDEHAGFYGEEVFAVLNEVHERHYSGFSRLVRSTFDEALPHFGDGTVDLLHIDGRHRYEDVVHDFESWLPKLSDRAIVLLHDINVRERGFGVWQFWRDLQSRYPCFEFAHGHGLGVVRVGGLVAEPLRPLFDSNPQSKAAIAEMYAQLGRLATVPHELETARAHLQEREARLAVLESENAARGQIIKELEVETKGLRAALNNAEIWARDREATIEVVGAETARIKETLAAAQLRDEELQRIRKQVAELRDAVAQAEREAQERSAVETAMRSNIAEALEAARHRSATAERSAAALELAERRVTDAERAADAAARKAGQAENAAEIARRRAETAERKASEAERNAAVLGEEVAALKTELADARHVGRTALQALAASSAAGIYREPRLGWRHAMRRMFGIVSSR